MFKKLISVALATCLLITPMSSFANNNTNLSEGVQPFVGGGDSHVWFKYGSYSKILSRNDLVELKKSLEMKQIGRNKCRPSLGSCLLTSLMVGC